MSVTFTGAHARQLPDVGVNVMGARSNIECMM